MRLKCFAVYCELTNALPAFRGAHYSPKARNAQQVLPLVAVVAVVAIVVWHYAPSWPACRSTDSTGIVIDSDSVAYA